jgi:anti-sigma factor RsiW
MTEQRHSIHELDLMAYADGLLDRDPERKREVEAYLQKRPKEAARVRDYTDQNDEIRRLYGPLLAEPVPERLKAALDNRPGTTLGYIALAAIAASLLLAGGVTGWMIGKSGRSAGWPAQAFVEQAMTTYLRPHLAADSGTAGAVEGAIQPLNWLSQHTAWQLQLPDLTPQGFSLVDKRLITTDGPEAAQVTYATPSGQRLSLFLRPRWQEEAPQFHFAENEGVTMVYWLDGALVYALVGQLGRQEMLAVVQAVRRSTHRRVSGVVPQVNTQVVPQKPQGEAGITTIGDSLLAPHDAPAQTSPVQRVIQTN